MFRLIQPCVAIGAMRLKVNGFAAILWYVQLNFLRRLLDLPLKAIGDCSIALPWKRDHQSGKKSDQQWRC